MKIGYYTVELEDWIAKWLYNRGVRSTLRPLYAERVLDDPSYPDGDRADYASIEVTFDRNEDEVRLDTELREFAETYRGRTKTDETEWAFWPNSRHEWKIRIDDTINKE